MQLRAILVASIGLNLILVAARLWSHQPPPSSGSATSFVSSGKINPAAQTASAVEPISLQAQALPWKDLQSDDLRIYTSNLRAAGFPEALVHKIIIAELDQQITAER